MHSRFHLFLLSSDSKHSGKETGFVDAENVIFDARCSYDMH